MESWSSLLIVSSFGNSSHKSIIAREEIFFKTSEDMVNLLSSSVCPHKSSLRSLSRWRPQCWAKSTGGVSKGKSQSLAKVSTRKRKQEVQKWLAFYDIQLLGVFLSLNTVGK